MTPERWQQVKAALDGAMSRDAAGRAQYLKQMAEDDPRLHAEVVSLLASEAEAGSHFLHTPAPAVLGPAVPHGRLSGRRIGAYRLLGEIGRGGMGEVYRAVRADAEYHQDVAIKLVHAHRDPGFVAARLRAERQILASLQHPNIAPLLDGGTTEDGIPYLVMQLVVGEPIDVYCTSHRLDTGARLELFLKVCLAVQYAHQHMVIHRDLKPSNILVEEGGVPKLLDFGIAKVLEGGAHPSTTDVTINLQRILTPHYASPEQFKGEIVTAASDVYSLGVVLYELLTGRKPFTVSRSSTTQEMEQSLLGRNPPKPSAAVLAPGDVDRRTVCTAGEGSAEKLSRRLRGDLDTIVLMALRPEPERRYATVELFAEDVRRHLQGLPVRARKDTVAYRTIKFVRRNAIAVTAGTLVAAALITGVVVSTREAQIAQAQRQRAEKRFKDVRALANTLIFDVHDSIRSLSGAAESRRLLINTALRYLESLSQEAHDDPALQRELAAAFLRLGDLQGAAFEANESEFNGAQHSYRHAYALLSASLAQDPSNEQARRDIITNAGKLSDLLWYTNDPSGALSFSEQTFSHARLLLSARPGSEKSQTLLAVCEGDYAYKLFEIRRDIPRALELLQRSLATLERARAQEASVSPQSRLDRTLALMYMRAEEIYITKGDSDRALQMAQSSRRLLSQMTSTAPDNADLLHLKAFADHHVAHALLATHQLSLAKQYEQSALQVFDKLAARDANVDEYRRDAAEAGTALAVIAVEERHPEEAISLLSILEKELQKLRTETAGALDFRLTRAQVQLVLGDAYSARAAESHRTASDSATDRQLACTAYNAALAQYAPLSGQRIEAARAQQELANKLRPCSPSSH